MKQVVDLLPQNIMTLIFHVYCSQELYQATDDTYQALSELENIFPSSAFLKTQRALLFYHSKCMLRGKYQAKFFLLKYRCRFRRGVTHLYRNPDYISSPSRQPRSLFQHSLCHGCTPSACICCPSRNSNRQIPPRDLLCCWELLLFEI